MSKLESLEGLELVKIKWLDSRGTTVGWEYKDEVESCNLDICEVESVGYLYFSTERYKTLVQSISKDQILGRLSIPVCSILETIFLDAKEASK